MAVNLKIDDQSLPAIAQWLLGGNGLPGDTQDQPDEAAPPDNSGNPAALPPSPGRDAVSQPAPGDGGTKLDALTQLLSGGMPSTAPPQPDLSMGQNAMPPADLGQSMV